MRIYLGKQNNVSGVESKVKAEKGEKLSRNIFALLIPLCIDSDKHALFDPRFNLEDNGVLKHCKVQDSSPLFLLGANKFRHRLLVTFMPAALHNVQPANVVGEILYQMPRCSSDELMMEPGSNCKSQ